MNAIAKLARKTDQPPAVPLTADISARLSEAGDRLTALENQLGQAVLDDVAGVPRRRRKAPCAERANG